MDLFIDKIIEKHVVGKTFELYRSSTQDSIQCHICKTVDFDEKFECRVTSADISPFHDEPIDLHVKCTETNKEYIIEAWDCLHSSFPKESVLRAWG